MPANSDYGARRRWRSIPTVLLSVGGASGCTPGAPSLSLFGAYFPAWLLCLIFGVVVTLLARSALLAAGIASTIPLQLLVCTSFGVAGGILLSFLWLGL